ncbi:mechanosensitive ion channel family protein [Facilibium subflavum]|uniref:mechanosensitive ion channel family protein n=1 Tax=Facilibium subflavum TaxID=2219058 RepID=UPI000E64A6D6|nr:mechanosensitive ion channel domain-containing protein [Facilibium subflavum]
MQFSFDTIYQYCQWFLMTALEHLPQVITALLILAIGWPVAKIIKNTVSKFLLKTRLDSAVCMFLAQILYILLIIFVVLMALSKLGIPTTPITGALVAVLVGIGMSLRSSVNLLTSGIIIVSSHPFRIGEFVDIGGTMGTVEKIDFIFCTLRTTDGREVKVPNNIVTSRVLTNYSNNEFRRNDFVIGIGYDSDLKKAKEILQMLIDNNECIIKIEDKMPIIRVDELADSSVNILVRYWTKRADFLETKWYLNESAKLAFDENNIEIPFPQRTIHVENDAPMQVN